MMISLQISWMELYPHHFSTIQSFRFFLFPVMWFMVGFLKLLERWRVWSFWISPTTLWLEKLRRSWLLCRILYGFFEETGAVPGGFQLVEVLVWMDCWWKSLVGRISDTWISLPTGFLVCFLRSSPRKSRRILPLISLSTTSPEKSRNQWLWTIRRRSSLPAMLIFVGSH